MLAGVIVTLAGLCIALVTVFRVPDYAVLVVFGIGVSEAWSHDSNGLLSRSSAI